MTNKIVGELNDEERAIIAERDDLREQFYAASTQSERDRLMGLINEATGRYDELRRRRRDAGEVE